MTTGIRHTTKHQNLERRRIREDDSRTRENMTTQQIFFMSSFPTGFWCIASNMPDLFFLVNNVDKNEHCHRTSTLPPYLYQRVIQEFVYSLTWLVKRGTNRHTDIETDQAYRSEILPSFKKFLWNRTALHKFWAMSPHSILSMTSKKRTVWARNHFILPGVYWSTIFFLSLPPTTMSGLP